MKGAKKQQARQSSDSFYFSNGSIAIEKFPFLAVPKKHNEAGRTSGMLGLGIGSGDKAAPYKTPHFIDYLKMNNKIDKR
jgi:hypothetical protein